MAGTWCSCFFLNLVTLFLLVSACNSSQQKSKKYPLVVVAFDGVGWQFLDSDLTDTPNFDFIAKTGVKAKNMITVNPSSTFPTFTTLVTGLYPESHGIVDNSFYDPVFNESFYLESDCSNFDPKFYNMSEPIWLTMEKLGRKTGAYFYPASTSYEQRPTYFADHVCRVNCSDWTGRMWQLREKMGRSHCKFDWFNDPYWHRIETAIKWLKSDEPPELLLLYFEQSDYDGHRFGPNHRLYWQSIETADRRTVGKLLRELRKADLLDKIDLIFMSDHSMVEKNNKKQINIFNETYVDASSYHGPGIWVEPDRLEDLYNNLTRVNSTHMKVYKREDVPESYHSKHNRRYPPLFVDVETGWTARWKPYNAEKEGEWSNGGHGWVPSEDVAAIFYARGPSFKEGYNTSKSLRAVDLYPLMCHLLGLEPLPNNGSLDNMKEFLRETKMPPSSHADGVTVNVTFYVLALIIQALIMVL